MIFQPVNLLRCYIEYSLVTYDDILGLLGLLRVMIGFNELIYEIILARVGTSLWDVEYLKKIALSIFTGYTMTFITLKAIKIYI